MHFILKMISDLLNFCNFVVPYLKQIYITLLKNTFNFRIMNNLNLVNNEFLRQFEIQTENSLARIEYSEQERKIFLTKIHIPKEIKDKSFEENFIIKVLEFISDKKLRVVPTSPEIARFVRSNRRYKELLPVGIKL